MPTTEIVLGVIAGKYERARDFGDLLAIGVKVREISYREIRGHELSELGVCLPHALDSGRVFLYPADGGHNFMDCQSWLVVSTRFVHPLAPMRPYAAFPLDFIQRYVPEIQGAPDEWGWVVHRESFQPTLTNARCVVCTSPRTAEDATSFGGIPKRNVISMLPFTEDYDIPRDLPRARDEEYFLWITNLSSHKNHHAALDALEQYYRRHAGTLRCLVLGPDTRDWDWRREKHVNNHSYVVSVRERLQEFAENNSGLELLGEVSEEQYWALLKHARFVWHNVIWDNGTFSVVEAAMVGTPALSTDYPQIRHLDTVFELGLTYFPARDPAAAATALRTMEERTANGQVMANFRRPITYEADLFASLQEITDRLQEDSGTNA
jgi:glycosyltransferase involved in cell wall biosynthesis